MLHVKNLLIASYEQLRIFTRALAQDMLKRYEHLKMILATALMITILVEILTTYISTRIKNTMDSFRLCNDASSILHSCKITSVIYTTCEYES